MTEPLTFLLEADRDRARNIAVKLEQECAEQADRINDALAWLADEPCTDREFTGGDGETEIDPCLRCIVASILAPHTPKTQP